MASDLMGDGAVSRTERAAQRIAELVREIEPGTRLGTKTELRELCGVSVGTFNEALRVAQARGLVAVRPGPGGGLFAAAQSPTVRLGNSILSIDDDASSIADAIRVRDALDPLLITDAAWYSSPADVAGYRTQIAAMADAVGALDADAFMHANWRLHELFAAVNPSPILKPMYLTLVEMIKSHTVAVLPVDEQPIAEVMTERYRIHAALVDAIADRDGDTLQDLIRRHSVKTTTTRTRA
ncbi:FadR/GntR family transcriptional regulator [Pseudonocardia endophytica]|uniref:DNA-binding FadR family transcriptional regulator n=1 Tax=Pseudonocardia endophytica TaxID=401976 RepID=A0A4R1I1W5_PSEEN|nr:FCD domain-containing protein [Pseudonocardia endophytica]TCK27575.1 DNA-binding FadR family transcriptional regulator [Pseudonocardia endophytica]